MKRRSRRRIWIALLVAIVLLAAACQDEGEEAPASEGELNVIGPGGLFGAALNAAFMQPFANETGIEVNFVEGGDDPYATVRAQVESGNVLVDVAFCAPPAIMPNADLWDTIDTSIVESGSDYAGGYDPGAFTQHAIIDSFNVVSTTWSTEAFPNNPPDTWAAFFDPDNEEPRAVPNFGLEAADFMIKGALLADGVSPENLVPFDLDRAFRKLDEIKPYVRLFYTSSPQALDAFRSGEVVMGVMFDGRVAQAAADGVPIAISYKQGLLNSQPLCVVKDAPNYENAMLFFEYLLSSEEQQAIFTELTTYGPPTDAGIEAAKALGVEDFNSLHLDEVVPETEEALRYVDQNSDEILNRWNAWVEG